MVLKERAWKPTAWLLTPDVLLRSAWYPTAVWKSTPVEEYNVSNQREVLPEPDILETSESLPTVVFCDQMVVLPKEACHRAVLEFHVLF